MMMRYMLGIGVLLACVGCGPQSPEVVSQRATTANGGEQAAEQARKTSDDYAAGKLSGIVDTYFQQNLKLNPISATFIGNHRYDDRLSISISPEHRERQRELEQKFLNALSDIDSRDLSGQDLLTYEIFRRGRENALEGLSYPSHLLPINQFFSFPNFFATLAAGTSAHPFNTVDDYDNMLSRMDDYVAWVDQAIVNMREGMEKGIVRPQVITAKVLPQLAAQVKDEASETLFWRPITNMPEDFSEQERERLTAAYRQKIEGVVVPSYQRLHDFIRDEYLPATTDTVGLTALPGGEPWYDFLVRLQTT
ncbi:MAG: DUF885 domain-containing protein, partial [Gammaproteobacteria bacterium]|nr:DUF885 domain-containing protein [Gammaproteobacteria bacterium]